MRSGAFRETLSILGRGCQISWIRRPFQTRRCCSQSRQIHPLELVSQAFFGMLFVCQCDLYILARSVNPRSYGQFCVEVDSVVCERYVSSLTFFVSLPSMFLSTLYSLHQSSEMSVPIYMIYINIHLKP